MGVKDYRSIWVEGGDQVGKGDATSRIISELERDGVNITFSSFPIYAIPTGAIIRSFLKGDFLKAELKEIDSVDIKMAFYILNRLEFMDICLSDEKYNNTLLVLDRSPFSNAVSIGYLFASGRDWNEGEVVKYIDRAMDLESFMISKLEKGRSIIQLKSEASEWKDVGNRAEDINEKRDVQEKSDKVYEMYKKIVGSGWYQIVTKGDNGWRARDDIWNDIKKILKEAYGDMGDIKQGVRYDIGFKEIVEGIYKGAKYDKKLFNTYNTAVKENVKDVMYASGLELAKQVVDSCKSIEFSNDEVKKEFRRILDIIPNMIAVFEYYYGKSFVEKLEKALD